MNRGRDDQATRLVIDTPSTKLLLRVWVYDIVASANISGKFVGGHVILAHYLLVSHAICLLIRTTVSGYSTEFSYRSMQCKYVH